ncbi:N-acetyltransferase family protein [Actinomyces oricola]
MVAQIEAGNAASIRLHAAAGFDLVGTIPAAGEKHGRVLDLTLMSLRL